MRDERIADVLDAAAAALARPPALAEGLPGSAYGAEFHAIEQHRLFPRAWCAVAVAARIPAPGDVLPVDLAGWPLLLVRDHADAAGGEGPIRVFHNLCRHRANRVVREPCRGLRRMACGWHGWTYGLDGRLLSTPQLGGPRDHHAAGLDPAGLGLEPVRSGRWLDYVFVNLDGNAPPLHEHLAPLTQLLADLDLAGLRHGAGWSDHYPGNWKICIEGAVEDYHLPWGHPQVVRGAVARDCRIDTAPGCYAATFTRNSYPPGATPQRYGDGSLPLVPGASAEDARGVRVVNVFPTGLMAITVDHLMLGLFTPDGAERTRLEFDLYFHPDAAADAAHAGARAAKVAGWQQVIAEDVDFVRDVQAGCALRDAAGIRTRFSPYWEGAVQHFQRLVIDTLKG